MKSALQVTRKSEKRFVVQEHSGSTTPHIDLMLEWDGALKTFRLPHPPDKTSCPTAGIAAEQIHDHPLKFLQYEGPLSNGKGCVRIIDSGTYKIIENQADRVVLVFEGKTLNGRYQLQRKEKTAWLIIQATSENCF